MKHIIRILLLAALGVAAVSAHADVIYNKRSLYRNIIVTDDNGQICMMFTKHSSFTSRQSCQYKDDHDKIVFDYARMVFVGTLVNPHPKHVLIVGLGGGTIPRTCQEMFPDANIDVVEIDPAVVDVAKQFFGFVPGKHTNIIVKDGRVFVKHAGRFGKKYDYIVLDAFNGDYIPEHLMTREWLEEVKQVLSKDGVLVANTFSVSQLYNNESVTYEKVFGWIRNVEHKEGNRIILTGNFPAVNHADLAKAAAAMNASEFERFGFTPDWLVQQETDKVDWNREARVLTDQYAPVNLLQGAKSGE